jgi:hypothetical protein
MRTISGMLRCRLLGHRFRFTAQDRTMTWSCARACGTSGSKSYPSAADARRYAAALDRSNADDLGRHAPPLGMLPLRIARVLRQSWKR